MACLVYRKRRNRSPAADEKKLMLERLARLILDDERHVPAAADFALKGLAEGKAGYDRARRSRYAA
jgi:hypothetical protein